MLAVVLFALFTGALGGTAADKAQVRFGIGDVGLPDVPGDSIVKLCPESNYSDALAIERIVNEPKTPYLNEGEDVFVWGNFTRDILANSTVDYQINATANTGDFGALNGTYHICDYLEQMRQPPNSNETENACPPSKGPVFINFAVWFADFLVAPGLWSVKFDAKTPEGDRIYCLQAEFDLQCPPWHDGPECLRNLSDVVDVGEMLQKAQERIVDGRHAAKLWPLAA